MESVTARAPAKVNLRLDVGPLRDDGYHELINVFHAVSVFDEVTAYPAKTLRVEVVGEGARHTPTGEDNLACAAARALAERIGVPPHVALRVHKSIPVAGGMAGGSADAAAALVACDALWQAGLDTTELRGLAAGLGSDVPFALLGGSAVGYGRGETLTPLPAHGTFHWVFALADGGLSTPEVYRTCDELRGDADIPVLRLDDLVIAALRSGDAGSLGARLSNDLQPAAVSLRPSLSDVLATGRAAGALGAVLSGSGPTCAFLVESGERASTLANTLVRTGVCRRCLTATGPAAGAAVMDRALVPDRADR